MDDKINLIIAETYSQIIEAALRPHGPGYSFEIIDRNTSGLSEEERSMVVAGIRRKNICNLFQMDFNFDKIANGSSDAEEIASRDELRNNYYRWMLSMEDDPLFDDIFFNMFLEVCETDDAVDPELERICSQLEK